MPSPAAGSESGAGAPDLVCELSQVAVALQASHEVANKRGVGTPAALVRRVRGEFEQRTDLLGRELEVAADCGDRLAQPFVHARGSIVPVLPRAAELVLRRRGGGP